MKNNRAQEEIQALLERLVKEGRERGIQVAAYLDGKLVVDAWAGVADAATGRPVDGETLFPVFSTTKGMAATIIHRLAERGKLDYDDRISQSWPEFGVNGKEAITIRQALNHTAGLPNVPEELRGVDLRDWAAVCAAVARLAPAWPPGSRMEYHAITYGWILGEVARRVAGRPFPQLLEEEICRPLGIKGGMYCGIPDEVEPRVAILEDTTVNPAAPPGQSVPQPVPAWLGPLHAWMNRPEVRRACVPASSGIMTARAIARHYAALVPGGVDGVELLPPARVKLATTMPPPWTGADGTPQPSHWALGYAVETGVTAAGAPWRQIGHGGFGGSKGNADPQCRFAFGLTKNLFSGNGGEGLVAAELRRLLALP
ncbi:MAG: serine hydrolase domain-containing protein [Lentisphaeria bacterium]|jgi:CubicO group peptidase (beta-lactamase class C family)